jgi:hypothetical protein
MQLKNSPIRSSQSSQAASASRRLFLCLQVSTIPSEASIYAIAPRTFTARILNLTIIDS